MALNINTLITDYNGAVYLQPGTAEWGYIEPQFFLQLPAGHNLPAVCPPVAGTNQFGANLSLPNFLKANYATLVDANALNNPDKALFGALLRAHYVSQGSLDNNLVRRCVLENEYNDRQPNNANWDDAANNIPANMNSAAIASYVKKYVNVIAQMMIYVFLSRGHHWQDEYEGIYTRLRAVNGMPVPQTWQLPTNKEIFRSLIHCFGVNNLRVLVEYHQANNLMTNPMRLRFTPHAPVAGAAEVMTSVAVLNEMRTEPWFSEFDAKFNGEIAALTNEMGTISANPYDYHIASRVVNGQARRMLSNNAHVAFKRISQFLLGYIDHLGRRHSLSGQKAITHHSGGAKPMADAFAKACDFFGKPDTNVVDMATFLAPL
jgi:hypothetical protein